MERTIKYTWLGVLCVVLWPSVVWPSVGRVSSELVLEGERPASQRGSRGDDSKQAASGGKVLGQEFGAVAGDFAEYSFTVNASVAPAKIAVLYAREIAGSSRLLVTLDGVLVGTLVYGPTGSLGNTPEHFRRIGVTVPQLRAGRHRLRLTVAPLHATQRIRERRLKSVPILDRVGNRPDKTSVGHGVNVALYTGTPSRFFYATHELGDIFSAVDGGTVSWYPDHTTVALVVLLVDANRY